MNYARLGPTSKKVKVERVPKYVIEKATELGYEGGYLFIEKEDDFGKHTGYTILINDQVHFIPTRTK
jgi:hypothetical protein